MLSGFPFPTLAPFLLRALSLRHRLHRSPAALTCSIFAFFPIQYVNDNGLGSAANISTTMFTTDGVPNDVISNLGHIRTRQD
jgi:hypothetical protein